MNEREGKVQGASTVYLSPDTAKKLGQLKARRPGVKNARIVSDLINKELAAPSAHVAYFLPDHPIFTIIDSREDIENSAVTFPFGRWLDVGLRDPDQVDPSNRLIFIGREDSLPDLETEHLEHLFNNDGELRIIVEDVSPILKAKLQKFKEAMSKSRIKLYKSDKVDSTNYAISTRKSGAVDMKIAPAIFGVMTGFKPGFFFSINSVYEYTGQILNDNFNEIMEKAEEIPLSD